MLSSLPWLPATTPRNRTCIGHYWRMKANSVLPVLEELCDGSYLSSVYPFAADRAKDIPWILVRVIEYDVTIVTGDSDEDEDAVTSFLLIASILEPAAVPAEDLADLYRRRWEIESSFGELKAHQRGPGVVLRSKTPDGVLQEIYGYLCTHCAI